MLGGAKGKNKFVRQLIHSLSILNNSGNKLDAGQQYLFITIGMRFNNKNNKNNCINSI